MRAGEWRRANRLTRFGWSAWLLRVMAWGRLARLGLAWGSAGLGTAWRGAFAPSRWPGGGCGPSGLPEASGVALREAEGLPGPGPPDGARATKRLLCHSPPSVSARGRSPPEFRTGAARM